VKFLFVLFFLSYALYASSLHKAVLEMDIKVLRQALKTNANINAFSQGKTALMLAVETGNLKIVEQLLQASAKVNLGNPSPLTIAFASDNSAIAKVLLKYKAKLPRSTAISKKGLIFNLLLERKYNIVTLLLNKGYKFKKKGELNAFSLALSFAPLSVVKSFIKHGANLNYKDPHLDRPIEIALRLKRHDVLRELIKRGSDIHDGYFLEIAAAHKDLLSLKILVESGCKIDKKRQNLLLLAIRLGDLSLLQELVKAGASLNFATKDKETALTQAIKYEHRAIISWILSSDIEEKVHEKAIFYAISHNDMQTLGELAEKEIGLNAHTKTGLTPILYANKLKKFNMISSLLEYDVDIESKDKLGENALFKSIRFFQNDILRTLIAKVDDINIKNKSGISAINLSLFIANYDAFKLLLEAEAKVEKKTLIMSVTKGLEHFFVKLKDKYFLASIKDEKSNSLLHMAASHDRVGILKRLILSGLDVEMINDRGETALHVAAKEGHKESCSLLLSFDANITSEDLRESKAMNIAMKYNHPKLGKWLENYQIKQEDLLRIKQEKEHPKDNNESIISTI